MIIPFVIAIVIGLLFIYFVFFAKKDSQVKEHMDSNMKIVNYNTEWCGYSKRFQPIWDQFTQEMKTKHKEIDVIDMKCDKDENKEKCSVPEVEGFPTVVLYKNGTPKPFNDSRSVESLLKFVEENL
jgi:thiol-disulfide isomerase/thioredoxin